jgi:hypothetical protein
LSEESKFGPAIAVAKALIYVCPIAAIQVAEERLREVQAARGDVLGDILTRRI